MVFAQSEDPVADTEFLWRQAVGGVVLGRPTVQAQSVVAVLDGGNVKAYSAAGRPLWNYSALGRLSPYVTRSREGTSYICRRNGVFIAVNRAGRELWRVNIGGALAAHAVCGWDGRVFIPTAKKLFCYTASGNLLWTREFDAAVNAGPSLDQSGGIMMALENGDVLRINPYGITQVKHLPSPPSILLSIENISSPNVATIPLILALYHGGDMRLIDMLLPPTDNENTETPGNGIMDLPRLPGTPLAAMSRGGQAAVVLANGQALMVSGVNGEVLWSADTYGASSNNDAAVIFDDRGVYVLGVNGVVGFTADGRRLWFSRLQDASGIPAFDDEGVLYSGGYDWILYAWKLEDREIKGPRTLYGPAPEGSYSKGVLPSSVIFDNDYVKLRLDDIRREILAGRVGAHEPEWLTFLMGVAVGDLRLTINRRLVNMQVRIAALELLSHIGSSETVPWLAAFFRSENDRLIKAAAARAIGNIGVDPNGIAINAFLGAAITGNPVNDEQMLLAIAEATGALCRFSGPPLSDIGARILVMLSGVNQHTKVRQQALHELRRMGIED